MFEELEESRRSHREFVDFILLRVARYSREVVKTWDFEERKKRAEEFVRGRLTGTQWDYLRRIVLYLRSSKDPEAFQKLLAKVRKDRSSS